MKTAHYINQNSEKTERYYCLDRDKMLKYTSDTVKTIPFDFDCIVFNESLEFPKHHAEK